MRTVARYSLTAEASTARDVVQDYLNLLDRAEAWLRAKGDRLEEQRPAEVIRYPDGREARVTRTEIDLGAGGLRGTTVAEPIAGTAIFETRLLVGLAGRTLAVLCDLRVGGSDQPLGPIRFDAACPRIVRDFLSYDLAWAYGGFALPKETWKFHGDTGARALVEVLTNPNRHLPLVVIAEHQGFLLHPGIAESILHDLACLAAVAVVDDAASWGITRALGSDWSCYNGALRLYWPGVAPGSDPRNHPLWTSRRLLDDVADTAAAATRIRSVLRRQVLSASAFAVREPHIFEQIRADERAQRFAAEREQLTSSSDYLRLAESYSREAEELRETLAEKEREIETLRLQIDNLQLALRWRETDHQEALAPEAIVPPETVARAVARAREECADALVFGPSVDESVEALAPNAGPPEKVLLYLVSLAELSRARASGTLATSQLEWLKQHNVAASQEAQGVRRSWGGREYDWHLKPAEAVSPDRCVRIYFDWDEESRRIIVGWVGRHP